MKTYILDLLAVCSVMGLKIFKIIIQQTKALSI
jgi:hypothetical protein